jgi:hypothetical protein
MKEMIIVLGSVLIGALLQFLVTKNLNKTDFRRNTEFETYVDYAEAVVGITHSQRNNDPERRRKYLEKLTEVKIRILFAGSDDTIKSLKKFEAYGAEVYDDISEKLFSNIIISMRKSLGSKKKLEPETVSTIIFGKQKNCT